MESLNVSCEPMDIDLSTNSIKNMDVSITESEKLETISRSPSPSSTNTFIKQVKQEPVADITSPAPISENVVNGFQNVKKYHIIMQPKKREGRLLIKLSVVFIIFLSAFIYHVNTFTCIEDLDVKNLKNTLNAKLYGQNKAIDLLTRSLDLKVSSKILFLYGGTGVGKTYATHLILEKVWNSSNVYHYLMPTFKEIFPNELLLGMSFCKSSILVVDDLSRTDFDIRKQIKMVIEKSEYLKKNITVILIYNSDDMGKNFVRNSNEVFLEYELQETFSDIESYKEFIKFERLTEEHLILCIKKELSDASVTSLEQLMKNFNVTQDGCKGVYTKMKLLNLT